MYKIATMKRGENCQTHTHTQKPRQNTKIGRKPAAVNKLYKLCTLTLFSWISGICASPNVHQNRVSLKHFLKFNPVRCSVVIMLMIVHFDSFDFIVFRWLLVFVDTKNIHFRRMLIDHINLTHAALCHFHV